MLQFNPTLAPRRASPGYELREVIPTHWAGDDSSCLLSAGEPDGLPFSSQQEARRNAGVSTVNAHTLVALPGNTLGGAVIHREDISIMLDPGH